MHCAEAPIVSTPPLGMSSCTRLGLTRSLAMMPRVVCLGCGGRNHDAARRCRQCGTGLEGRAATEPVQAGRWELAKLVVPLPRLRWFETPKAWIPIIERCLRRPRVDGWQAALDLDVPALVASGCFRRGEEVVDRAAQADRIVLPVKRQLKVGETVRTP